MQLLFHEKKIPKNTALFLRISEISVVRLNNTYDTCYPGGNSENKLERRMTVKVLSGKISLSQVAVWDMAAADLGKCTNSFLLLLVGMEKGGRTSDSKSKIMGNFMKSYIIRS
jgi:hypothetical protein